MKIWKYYIIEPDSRKSDIELYAVTNDKNIAKEFKRTRNMKIFKLIESEMKKEEYIEFLNEEAYGNELIYMKLLSDGVDDTNRYEIREVSFLVTKNEESTIDNVFDSDMLFSQDEKFWYNTPPSHIFNEDISKALRILEYPIIRHVFVNNVLGEYDEYAMPMVTPNTLNLFLKIYGNTLNL